MHKVQLARLGQTMEQGSFVQWLRKEGEAFKAGDDLYEIETEKSVVTVEATRPGSLVRLLVAPGDNVLVGDCLAVVADPGETLTSEEIATAETGEEPLESPPSVAVSPATVTGGEVRKVNALPKARALAAELGLDIAALTGTGPDGAITVEDVRRAAELAAEATNAQPAGAVVNRVVRLTGVRKAMAEAVTRSWQAPQFTQIFLADASAMARRKDASRGNLSYMDLIVEAVVAAAARVPDVMATYDNGEITYYENVDLAIATATSGGLVLPVLRKAEAMDLGARAQAWRSVVERARDGRLTPADTAGPSIALSNLGRRGVDTGTPLLPAGLSTVVFFGAFAPRALVVDDRLEARPSVYVSIAYDHRVVDGELGSQFTAALKAAVESEERVALRTGA